jgi:hypothetical protein
MFDLAGITDLLGPDAFLENVADAIARVNGTVTVFVSSLNLRTPMHLLKSYDKLTLFNSLSADPSQPSDIEFVIV